MWGASAPATLETRRYRYGHIERWPLLYLEAYLQFDTAG